MRARLRRLSSALRKPARKQIRHRMRRSPPQRFLRCLQRFVILTDEPADLKKVKAPAAPAEPLVRPVNPPKPPKPPEDEIIRFFNDFRAGKEQHPSRAVLAEFGIPRERIDALVAAKTVQCTQ